MPIDPSTFGGALFGASMFGSGPPLSGASSAVSLSQSTACAKGIAVGTGGNAKAWPAVFGAPVFGGAFFASAGLAPAVVFVARTAVALAPSTACATGLAVVDTLRITATGRTNIVSLDSDAFVTATGTTDLTTRAADLFNTADGTTDVTTRINELFLTCAGVTVVYTTPKAGTHMRVEIIS